MKLSKGMREFIANGLESYMNIREQCLISEVPPETEDKQLKTVSIFVGILDFKSYSEFNEIGIFCSIIEE